MRNPPLCGPIPEPLNRGVAACIFIAMIGTSCGPARLGNNPTIRFTRVPEANATDAAKNDIIEGVATGYHAGQQIVLYAKRGKWWVQPLVAQPFTTIGPGSKWVNGTHLGSEYAALLVNAGYRPSTGLDALPDLGPEIEARAIIKGASKSPSTFISFSGYEWRVRNAPSARGGGSNYDPANVSTDGQGALHLKIAKSGRDWTCSEVSLDRSLGYGTYSFVVRNTELLEPAAVFSMFTYDYAGGAMNNREMAIEISQWEDPASKNSQYVVQPFYIAANVSRFISPPGKLTYSFDWEPGRVSFRTVHGSGNTFRSQPVAEKTFTSGVPSPGLESVRMNVYVWRSARIPLRKETEVVVEQFTYLP
jgi:hypothetical protein